MATQNDLVLSYADWAKRVDPDGRTAAIVELLQETNEILLDAAVVEGNLPTGHRTTVRTGLPTVAWRMLNYGVQPSKSRTKQVDDACGMLEAYSEVDKSLADLNGNSSQFRLSEDKAFLEAMNQEMADAIFYGNALTDPSKITGLSQRYSLTTADNGANIVSGGSNDTDNTSIWLVVWDSTTCHLTFPKGSKAGFAARDLGEVTLTDADGGRYQGYRTHYKWDLGLVVRDWRYVVRIANIELSDILATAATGADLCDLMVQAIELLPSATMGKPAFYCNRTIRSWLRRQIRKASNVNLTLDTVGGQRVLMFDGIPVRRCDQIVNDEALVS